MMFSTSTTNSAGLKRAERQQATHEALDSGSLRKVYDRAASRYDFYHGLVTAHADQRGRELLVQHAVKRGDCVLDCGAGTGSTALLAAEKVGPTGKVVLFDLSEGMLEVAKEKAGALGLADRLQFSVGDMSRLPFADCSFDAVLSTYSLCPVQDPSEAALELYRVVKPGGRVGVAHSAQPRRKSIRFLAKCVERIVWNFPSLSLGCRAVSVLPALQAAGARPIYQRTIGVPLWPFLVLVVEKPQ